MQTSSNENAAIPIDTMLSPFELSALEARLLVLYADSPDLESFPALAIEILRELTGSDFTVFGEVDHETWNNRGLVSDTSPEVISAMRCYDETPREHPYFEVRQDYFGDKVLFLSDCLSPAEQEASLIMQRAYGPIGVQHILAFVFQAGSKVIVFGGLRRRAEAFSEHDRAIATFLRKHFELAYHQCAQRSLRAMDLRHRISLSFPQFTARQLDVAVWLALGKSNAVMAKLLGISEAGVKYHLRSIFDQTGTEDRTATALVLALAEPAFISANPPYPCQHSAH